MSRLLQTTTKDPHSPQQNEKSNDASSKDKELVTLIILVIVIASCHPCMSQEIALQLGVSMAAVRTGMLAIVATIILGTIVFAAKGSNTNEEKDQKRH